MRVKVKVKTVRVKVRTKVAFGTRLHQARTNLTYAVPQTIVVTVA